jgi:hypothetical protein
LFLKVFFQTNSAIERQNFQAIFVYRYRRPFGTLQLAFQRGARRRSASARPRATRSS